MSDAPDGPEDRQSPLETAALVAAVAVVYGVAGRLGLHLAVVNPSASAVWPPTGIAMAACLLLGAPAVAGVWLGAFVVNASTASAPMVAAVIATGNTLEAWFGARLLRRYAGGPQAFHHTAGLLKFVFLAGLGATLISPTVGVTAITLEGGARWAEFGQVWLTWWSGDMCGALLMTPLIILWTRPFDWAFARKRMVECALLFTILAAVSEAVFGWWPGRPVSSLPVGFVLVPTLLWAGLRLGPRMAATAGAILAALALAGTVHGTGPFAGITANTGLILLQGYVTVSALTALLVATLAHEQHQAIVVLGEANAMTTSGYLRQGRLLRQTESELQQRDEMNAALAQAMEDIGEGLAILDVESGRFIRVNAALCRLHGYSEAELLALPSFVALVDPGEVAVVEERRRRRERGEAVPDHFEFTVLHRTGRRIRIEASMKVVAGHPGNWIVALVRDITERRKADELRRARDMADAANRAKSRFLATVSHELRTPLTAIIGFANLLVRNRNGSFHPEDRRHLERIQMNSRELLDSINDLLDLSRIEAGRMDLLVAPVNLPVFLVELGAHFEDLARQKGLELRVECAPGMPSIATDGAKLRRILVNLLANAIKFTERGFIAIRAVADCGGVRLSVEDSGIGIPADKLALVFEAFQQAEEGSSRKYGGVGLGLAICRSLTDMLGATLSVESRVGEGTTFALCLPGHPLDGQAGQQVALTGGAHHG